MVKALMSKNFSLGHAEYLEIYDGVKTGVEFTNSFFLSLLILLSVSSVFIWLLAKGIKARKTSAQASGELAPLQLAT